MVEQLPITSSKETLSKVLLSLHISITAGYTSTAYFWSGQGVPLRYCGTTAIEGFDEVIIQGSTDPKNPKFSGFYVKNNKVVAVVSIGTDPTVSLSAELLYGTPYNSKRLIFRGPIPACGYLKIRYGYTTNGFTRRGCAIGDMQLVVDGI